MLVFHNVEQLLDNFDDTGIEVRISGSFSQRADG